VVDDSVRRSGSAKDPRNNSTLSSPQCRKKAVHRAGSRPKYLGAWSLLGWRRGVVVSGVRRMNEVNARRARLVPGWVTVFGRVYYLGM